MMTERAVLSDESGRGWSRGFLIGRRVGVGSGPIIVRWVADNGRLT